MLKTVSSITNAIGALNYKGTWNASTNTPTLADGTGAKGDYYVVSTAGTQTFDGILLFFGAGDWIVYNGAVWQRVEGGSDGNFSNVTLNSTDAGATAGPLLDLYRNSATPAASDTIGEIKFNGKDSAGNKQQYAVIHGSILSPTSTTEQGQIHFETATAGASTEKMIIGTTNLVINDIGAVFNVRIEGDTDDNLFYTDATNSRVGVGTISPSTKLDVNGTVTASGNLLVGTTTSAINDSNSVVIVSNNGSVVGQVICNHGTGVGSGEKFANFGYAGSSIGSITQSGTVAVSYNLTSDQRLKENIQDAAPASALIDAIQVRQFDWKKDNTHQRYGFVAQELVTVAPEAVYAPADPNEMMAVDYSKLVPMLVKEIQSLRVRLAVLESK